MTYDKASKTFERFLDGKISAKEYYRQDSFVANDLVLAARQIGQEDSDNLVELNRRLHRRIQESKPEGADWKTAAQDPTTKMYLDIAAVLNSRAIHEVHAKILDRAKENFRTHFDTEIEYATADGFIRTMLSPGLEVERFNRLLFFQIKQCIIDLYRRLYGRAGRRPQAARLNNLNNIGEDFINLLKSDEMRPDEAMMERERTLSEPKLLAAVNDYGPIWQNLSPHQTDVLKAYIAKVKDGSSYSYKELADRLGMNKSTFGCHLSHAREMIMQVPELAEIMENYFGYTPFSLRKFNAKQAKYDLSPEQQERVKQLRHIIGTFFTNTEGKPMAGTKIASEAGINVHAVTYLRSGSVELMRNQSLSNKVRTGLCGLLGKLGKSPDEIQLFEKSFDELRRIVGWTGEHKNAAAIRH